MRRQVARLTTRPDITTREVADLASRWAPYRTTAMLQLWADYLVGASGGGRAGCVPHERGGGAGRAVDETVRG